jgi:hypothetical protein
VESRHNRQARRAGGSRGGREPAGGRPAQSPAGAGLLQAGGLPARVAAAPDGPHRVAHAAAQPRQRAVGRRRRARADELHDGLGLAEVQAAVQEGPQRELPGPRRPRAGLDRGAQHAAAADRAAVDLQLDHVLARVRPF